MATSPSQRAPEAGRDPVSLSRRIGVGDAVIVGLGAMIGAGVFAAVGPAARVAGSGLLIGLGVAALVAYCNAVASADLAALMPRAGGTYVYGRERLGPLWGFLAGWGFVVGKMASCAAMALTFGAYAAPGAARWLGLAAVAAMVAVNLRGVQRTAQATRVIVALVGLSLACVIVGALAGGQASPGNLRWSSTAGAYEVLQAAGLLFFAFAGYARIATLAEEVRDPERTIPRAIPLALGITLAVYAAVAVSALLAVGPERLGASGAPLRTAVEAGALDWLAPAVRIGGAIAALGVLLSVLAGVSRTTLAMARNRELPPWLAAIHPATRIPHHAETAIGILVGAVVQIAGDVRDAIGFSSFTVLTYYAIANASAWTLPPAERRWPRALNALGALGCAALAFTLPVGSVAAGAGVLLIGVVGWIVHERRRTATRGTEP
jgi:APA family basic amino acid/polyamine antiporter